MRTNNPEIARLVRGLVAVAAFGVVGLAAGPALAEVPVSITQQGRLVDDGEPMTGQQDLHFEMYDAPADGNLVWSDEVQADLGDDGIYTVTLGGQDNPIDATVLQDGEVFLELTVDGETFDPRVELTSVPFATIAQTAEVAQSVVDGGVTSDALAEDAVDSDSVDSISWDDITDVPSDIGSDTLAELSCSADEFAVYNGDAWACAARPDGSDFALSGDSCSGDRVVGGINTDGTLECVEQRDTTYSGEDFALSGESCSSDQVVGGINADGTVMCIEQEGTTYTAGTGLELSGEEFSADVGYFDDNYLPAGQSIHVEGSIEADDDIEADGDLRANADASTSLSYLRFRDSTGPRLFHSDNSDMFAFRDAGEMDLGTNMTPMDLSVSGDGEFGGELEADHQIRTNADESSSLSYYRFRSGSGPRLYHNNNLDSFRFRGGDELYVDGDLAASGDKPFVQPHSSDPGKQIRYIAEESGQPVVSWRDSGTLEEGRAVVELPEHFVEVVSDDEQLTTTVTPHGQWAPLYVQSESPRQIVVAVADQFDGVDDVEFDIRVEGVRAGREDSGGIVENTHFTPEAMGIDENGELIDEPAPHIKARLIENGTLNQDGTVNVETAREQGWDLEAARR